MHDEREKQPDWAISLVEAYGVDVSAEIIENYFAFQPELASSAIEELLLESGVYCGRLVLPGEFVGLASHQEALRVGILPFTRYRFYTDWHDAVIGIPTMESKLSGSRALLNELHEYYHNPVYPRDRTDNEYALLFALLFPADGVYEIYRWSDDWAEFFDPGKEWFGTGAWSVYDHATGIFTLFFVSDTD